MDGWQDKTNQVVENVKGRIKRINESDCIKR